jgi:hypothetical protein
MALTTVTQQDDRVEGDTVLLVCTFGPAGAPVDPVDVTLTIQEPGRPLPAPIVKTKAAAELDNPSTGVYTFPYQANTAGTVRYNFFGETPATSSSKRVKGELRVERAL